MSRCRIFAASNERKRPILASVSVWWLMSIRRFSQQTAEGAARAVRSLRLTTGLVLFAYAASHFPKSCFRYLFHRSHAGGQHGPIEALAKLPRLVALYGSFLIHSLLGLYAVLRRRHLRLPAAEAWQFALGLTIPLLLIRHATGVRLGVSLYDMEFGYAGILYRLWVVSPDLALPELSGELATPLRTGIGIHVGTAVVGWISAGASQSLQFRGDTGNIGAKLEAHTRAPDCTLVTSAA